MYREWNIEEWLKSEPADDRFDRDAYTDEQKAKRTPEGQTLAKKFPHLEYASIPEVSDPTTWELEICGEVENPCTVVLPDLIRNWPLTKITRDFHCITGWSVFDTEWAGVMGLDIIERVNPSDEVTTVLVHGMDEFSTCLWVEDFMQGLIAYAYRAAPLAPHHGFPLRFVAPEHLWQYKACKWVQKLEFLKEHQLGFWEIRAYSDSALVWENDRYANPLADAGKPMGKLRKEALASMNPKE